MAITRLRAGDVICNNRQSSLSLAVHIQANLEDDLVKEALRTVRKAHHRTDALSLFAAISQQCLQMITSEILYIEKILVISSDSYP